MDFSHLEVHSHFTLLGATPSVPDLAARAHKDGLTHLALTDTNALYGAVAFDRACREAGVQPIIGMTVTVRPTPLPPLPTTEGGDKLPSPGRGGVGGEVGEAGQLVLLATDAAGYRSLCRLSSLIQGNPERETLAARGLGWEELAAHREGLICLSGGRRGWIERFLRAGDYAAAQLCAGRLAGVFEENAALALELHTPDDEQIATELVALGRRLGLPVVAVQPVYSLAPADAPRLRLLAAIRANTRLDNTTDFAMDEPELEDAESEGASEESPETRRDPSLKSRRDSGLGSHPLRMTAGDFTDFAVSGLTVSDARLTDISDRAASCMEECHYWQSPAEIATRFVRFPQAIVQAGEIAARCGACLPDGRPIWPALKLPDAQTPDEALAELTRAGCLKLEARNSDAEDTSKQLPVDNSQFPATSSRQPASSSQLPASSNQLPASDRLARELTAIAQHGYAPLFLVVADIVRFARAHEIPVSTRGSVANSLVAYCAGITTVDPIAHGLLFERFLNPARANPPDIDLDFCSRRRDEVLRYVRDTYGADHVALIGTVSTLRPQSAVRETGKALGPLTFDEFEAKSPQRIYISATPGPYERAHSGVFAEQVVRPTGLLDPVVEVRPATTQVDDLLSEITLRVAVKERVLVTTLTKRMAEDLTEYLSENGVRVRYLHSDIDTVERVEIIRDLRLGQFDVLVGINLLREGLDIPEVSLVAILDADKEGFLRSVVSLVQTIGRAARNINGKAILYGDRITRSMQQAIEETDRRRDKQRQFNCDHHIEPATILKSITDILQISIPGSGLPGGDKKISKVAEYPADYKAMTPKQLGKKLKQLEDEMYRYAKNLEFEQAARIRDEIKGLQEQMLV